MKTDEYDPSFMEFSTEGEKKVELEATDSDEEDITDARVKLREMGLPKVREHEGDYTRFLIDVPITNSILQKLGIKTQTKLVSASGQRTLDWASFLQEAQLFADIR